MTPTPTDPAAPPDLIALLPSPDALQAELAEALMRADLLRALLRVARRKATYAGQPSGGKAVAHAG
jgi:hypothetical protein